MLSQMVGIFECIVPAPQDGDMLPCRKAVNTQFSCPNKKMLWKLRGKFNELHGCARTRTGSNNQISSFDLAMPHLITKVYSKSTFLLINRS